jgi:hypothetical protein
MHDALPLSLPTPLKHGRSFPLSTTRNINPNFGLQGFPLEPVAYRGCLHKHWYSNSNSDNKNSPCKFIVNSSQFYHPKLISRFMTPILELIWLKTTILKLYSSNQHFHPPHPRTTLPLVDVSNSHKYLRFKTHPRFL